MANIRQKGTTPERMFARWLRANRIHASAQARDLAGSPDFVNRRRRWVVWVHGCFWHRHHGCSRTTTPRRNRAFWTAKFRANVLRDRRNKRAAKARGFEVFEVWECDIEKNSPALMRLRAALLRAHRSRANQTDSQPTSS
ncbi:MAG: very short patch repair endonuclease [Myxococcaceae bacterium]|nr:very short patch repair endonuclease [Myxococcaceae bacterium]